MRKYVVSVVLALVVGPVAAHQCFMPDTRQEFPTSDVVVAAEVRDISVKPSPDEPGKYRQTVLWRVYENWKGPHTFGKEFTTRTTMNCPTCSMYKLRSGRMMVLYLYGKEPYVLPWCSHTNFLEYSLKDIPLLYKLSGARHGT